MDLAKNLLLATLSMFVFFGSAEMLSRWVRPIVLPGPTALAEMVPDYLLFFRNPANHTRLAINDLGLRGPDVREKEQDEFRILSLGESSTFGWRVPYTQTYSFLLERRLGRIDGRRVRVINGGVPAYTSVQGLLYLRYRGLDLEPDAVLVYFGANDFTPITYRTTRSGPWDESLGLTDRELFEKRRSPLVRLASLLLGHSNLFRLAALSSQNGEGSDRLQVSRVPPEDRRWVLGQLLELSQAHGFRLVVLIPWYREFELHIPLLREFATSNEVAVIDLPERLGEARGTRSHLFLDRFHPSARGHQQIAEVIETELRRFWDAVEPNEP